ncbi:MAG TPA: DUF4383 domain-containing protein [Flavisolibacter sp.]
MNTRTASLLIGIIFLLVGILGFVENPIIGESPDAMFHADTVHNMVHIISGVLFLLFALAAPSRAGAFLKIFGLVYLALGVWGAATVGADGMTTLAGFLHVNEADNYLHIGLGVVIFLAGLLPDAVVPRRSM